MEITGKVLREVEFRDRLRGYDFEEVDEDAFLDESLENLDIEDDEEESEMEEDDDEMEEDDEEDEDQEQ